MVRNVGVSGRSSILHHVEDGLTVHGDVAQVPPPDVRRQGENREHTQRDRSCHPENESYAIAADTIRTSDRPTDFFPLPTQTDWRDLRLGKILFHPLPRRMQQQVMRLHERCPQNANVCSVQLSLDLKVCNHFWLHSYSSIVVVDVIRGRTPRRVVALTCVRMRQHRWCVFPRFCWRGVCEWQFSNFLFHLKNEQICLYHLKT